MKTCIDVPVSRFLASPLEWMNLYRRSHVDQVQLYVGGIPATAPLDDTARARDMLISAGFDTAAIAVPVGHPTDSRQAPSPEEIARHSRPLWRFRTGRNGAPEYFSHELTDRMISDTLSYVRDYASLGFTLFFMDDDLRSANLQQEVGGCFCPDCMAAFKAETGFDSLEGDAALTAWTRFQSRRVTRVMEGMRKYLPHPGIMIMIHGDERHGISVPDLAKIDGIHVRVGEEHFFDGSARTVQGRAEEFMAVSSHLYRLKGVEETYSESTAVDARSFPSQTLTTPEHMYSKALLALTAGVKNIDWMCEKHWDMMAARNDDLRAFAEAASGKRAWPVHVARHSQVAGRGLYPDLTATLLGVPAAGVFAPEADGGEVLVISSDLLALPEWKAAAEKYTHVLPMGDDLPAALRRTGVPMLEKGTALVSWIPDKRRAAVYNPQETPQTVALFGREITLPAGESACVDQ